MNLDDLDRFKQLDTLNMLGEIDNLPDQLGYAYQLGMKHVLPDLKDFKQVVITGMDRLPSEPTCSPHTAPLSPRYLFLSTATMVSLYSLAVQRRWLFAPRIQGTLKRYSPLLKLHAKPGAILLSSAQAAN